MTTTDDMITVPGGSTVRATRDDLDNLLVICDHPDAPAALRHCEVGRIIEGGFQSPFLPPPVAISPGMLRAIADLIERTDA